MALYKGGGVIWKKVNAATNNGNIKKERIRKYSQQQTASPSSFSSELNQRNKMLFISSNIEGTEYQYINNKMTNVYFC